MKTLSDRFRHWYEYEQDCNAKILAMLNSVPMERRSSPEFQRAVDLLAHLVIARRMWLNRLGLWPEVQKDLFPRGVSISELPTMLQKTESAWIKYLQTLDENELAREFTYEAVFNGTSWRWDVESLLTQVFGHAWYHRGQIALVVDALGGKSVDTDYIFWHQPTPINQVA
jgi:uncharacterized damage-inducible protein DinB